MPLSRFALYFFALTACSTIAFASGHAGKSAANDGTAALDAASERPFTPSEWAARPHRRFHANMAQVARAD